MMSSFQDWLRANQNKTLGQAQQARSLPLRAAASSVLESTIRGGRPFMNATPLGFLANLVIPTDVGDATTMPKQQPSLETQRRLNAKALEAIAAQRNNREVMEDLSRLRELGLSPITPPGN